LIPPGRSAIQGPSLAGCGCLPLLEKALPDSRHTTKSLRSEDVERVWFVVDAKGKVLGRLASQVAHILRGKHKPLFTPHVDAGDFVVVVNAREVEVTGRKREGKIYHRHSGYPGGIHSVTLGRLLETHPERVIEGAVRGMLPKGRLGRRMARKLKVYAGAEHPHAAQKPEPLEIRT
jgi:large subunit ribosomal protein L13